jgi:signal transduction histidine kinase/CheY-like chemotaxis protein
MEHESFDDGLVRRVFAAIPAGLVVLNTDLEMIGVTDAYLRQTGTSRGDIIGHHAFDAFPDNPDDESPTSMNAMRTSYLRVIDTARPDSTALQRYDIAIRDDPNGAFETRYWSVINSPVLDDDGSVIAIIHRADDVTGVLQQSEAELEQPSEQAFLRNSAILQRSEEVQEANRLLREADSAKNDFLSRMSHELRTPLNAILGFAQLMELAELAANEQDSVGQILRAGRHLLSLINDVLDLSGIESGRVRLSLETVDFRGLTTEVIELLRTTASGRDISLETADLPPVLVLADRQRLKQILLNLVSNAIKYNRRGGHVAIVARTTDGRLEIGIQDDGPGISPEHQTRLFTPFDRLGADKSEVEGTGLGLALSRSLAEAMGGAIRLETSVGHGSTFWIDLKLSGDEASEVTTSSTEDPNYVNAAGALLYVEDNLANAKLMERVVEQFSSLRLITAMQGSMAVELAENHQPGLILLDLNLPDVPGEVVLSRLKAEPRTRDIPVVVVSADASPRQAERLREKGALAYVTKPFDIVELLELISSCFVDASKS